MDECSSHWNRVYLESEKWPLPDFSKGVIASSPTKSADPQMVRRRTRNGMVGLTPQQVLVASNSPHRTLFTNSPMHLKSLLLLVLNLTRFKVICR